MPASSGYLEDSEAQATLSTRDVLTLIDKRLGEAGLVDEAQSPAIVAGADNVNFPTAAASDEVAVVHGLGVVPQVFVQLVETVAAGSYVRSVTEDQFICRFETAGGGALTGHRLFYWLAVA